jgi:hypothetical protein
MTKLKNRGNMFVVVRQHFGAALGGSAAVCGSFSDMDDADDYKGACEQRWLERVGTLDGVEFEVQLTTYYG